MKGTLQSEAYNVLLVKSTYMKIYQATTQCLKLQLFIICLSEQFFYDLIYLLYSSQNGQLHKKNVKNHQKKVRELKKCIDLKEQANYELSLQLKEMLVSVSERMHIFEAAGESSDALKGTSKEHSANNSKAGQCCSPPSAEGQGMPVYYCMCTMS